MAHDRTRDYDRECYETEPRSPELIRRELAARAVKSGARARNAMLYAIHGTRWADERRARA